MTVEEMQKRLEDDWSKGEAIRQADIEAKIARRTELGLSLVCTIDELDSTSMPEGYSPV
jgi:hypothetical protein